MPAHQYAVSHGNSVPISDLITGSGPKHRILKEDVQAYVKTELSKVRSNGTGLALNLLPWPQVNFCQIWPD